MRYLAFGLLTLAFSVSAFAAKGDAPSSSLTAVGVVDTSNVSTGQSLSAMFSIDRNWLQTFMTIDRTQRTFIFGLGGIYKFTVAGDLKTGFHVGPGISLGTTPVAGRSKFAFGVFGLAGAHFTLFERLMLSVDGGPMLNVVTGDADFRMKPLGETLGLGIHYLF